MDTLCVCDHPPEISAIARILASCETDQPLLPPTALYCEGWMLRLVLDWASRNPYAVPQLSFLPGSRWYSEALLPSPFPPRKRGDDRAEGATHADAVIGHFQLCTGRGDIELRPRPQQFTVVEAKMGSNLASGVKYAPNYNQAARNIACMAALLEKASVRIDQLQRLAFIVLAPKIRIDSGVFSIFLNKAHIVQSVRDRVYSYDPAKLPWLETQVESTVRSCSIEALPWEEVIDQIASADEQFGRLIRNFYGKCLRLNRVK